MKCRSIVFACLTIVVGAVAVRAQQFSAWSTAANLGPVVNSAAAEGCAFVAKSELTLFVVSTKAGGYGNQDIYVSQRDSPIEPWGPLQNVGSAINSSANDLCPTLSIDGHHLYFVSDRAGGYGKQDLYVASRHNKRDDFDWEPPVNLGIAVNSSENDFTPTLFEDEASGKTILYFGSDRPGGVGLVDIYSAEKAGEYFFGAVLVPELSTPFIDERPNVRKDGLEMFFDSNRPGGLGSTDLWVSIRQSVEDPWSPPVNVGAAVNTASGETRPALSFDGETLYFGSSRPGGSGGTDIYVTTRTKERGSK